MFPLVLIVFQGCKRENVTHDGKHFGEHGGGDQDLRGLEESWLEAGKVV